MGTVYIVGPVEDLKDLTDGNAGSVLTSLDGSLMLLENEPGVFADCCEECIVMVHSEIQEYLILNKDDWSEPVDLE